MPIRTDRAPGLLPAKRTLDDGTHIEIRTVQDTDRALISEGFSHLSEQSRFMRFLGPRQALSRTELDQLTDPEDKDNVALGAVTRDGAHPVGLARFIRTEPGGAEAEIAITITDEFQRRGAGKALIETLAQVARTCGVTQFLAFTHRENHAMHALLRRYGWTGRPTFTNSEIRMPVSAFIAG